LVELGPWVVNLHIKDFAITRPDHKMGFTVEGRPAGQGRLDVPWLLETLRGVGRDPNAILELWTPPQGDLAATIAVEDRWAAQSVAYLRELIPA
jgi:sugar phosphate isomerase/epimerase